MTIAEQLNVTEFPFIIPDARGNIIYREELDKCWQKSEFDLKSNNETYFENSKKYWCKSKYDLNNNVTSFENSDKYWRKSEFDLKSNIEIYYENSMGVIRDNRPKSIPEYTMKNLLWLDDIRNPYINEEGKVPTRKNGKHYNIDWVLNYEQFVKWIELFGLPDAISFDHDLADEDYTPKEYWYDYQVSKDYQDAQIYQEKTGMDCAKWLVDYCIDNKNKLPEIFVHSANPVGADNIKGLLDNYLKHCS